MDWSSTANETILKLKEIFSIYGLLVELVSDNGLLFNLAEFNAFCQANGIKPIKSPPYHSQNNGSAEKYSNSKKSFRKSSVLFLKKRKEISKNLLHS